MPNDEEAADTDIVMNQAAKTIVIVAFDGAQLLDVTGPADVFGKAEQLRPGSYRLVLASPHGGNVMINSGVVLGRTIELNAVPDDCDTILVAGSDEDDLRRAIFDHGVAAWVHERASRTRRTGSVCTGAFVLAAAGLLDGRRATTHWHSCDLLQQLCTRAQVQPDVIYTVDPPIYTSAGVTAGIDLALALVEEDFGRAAASAVAHELVVALRRPAAQSQMGAVLRAQSKASNRVSDLVAWIADNPSADLSIAALAAMAGMSDRNFSRVFHAQAGQTPARYVEASRVEHACGLLSGSDWPLERIAETCGFGSTDALQNAFRRCRGQSPASWRRNAAR